MNGPRRTTIPMNSINEELCHQDCHRHPPLFHRLKLKYEQQTQGIEDFAITTTTPALCVLYCACWKVIHRLRSMNIDSRNKRNFHHKSPLSSSINITKIERYNQGTKYFTPQLPPSFFSIYILHTHTHIHT